MSTKDFIATLKDESLAKKMSEAKSPKEAYAIAKANGVTDSFDEFANEMKKLKNAGELSEDDLESVAGGASTTEIISAVSTTVGAAASAF